VSFDTIAPYYRGLETAAFGNALQRARTRFIDKVDRPKRALLIGEGNGRFLCELLRVHPDIRVDCVDASQRMLQISKERVRRRFPGCLPGIQFLHADILTWLPQHTYDLLVTHFLLDCFGPGEVKMVVEKIARGASAGAIWLLADFTIPSGNVARLNAKIWLGAMYAFFRMVANLEASSLIDPSPYLRENGFVYAERTQFYAGMVKSELWRAPILPKKRS
jgi:ubiquinone/menaquinone biosynthesis C-methylase UbiE